MKSDSANTPRRARLTFLAVVAAFTLPILIAWLMTSGLLPWIPRARLNYGTLIEPTIDLAETSSSENPQQPAGLKRAYGEWSLVVIPSIPCTPACSLTLDHMYRIRLAINDPADRLHPVALIDNNEPTADFSNNGADPKLAIVRINKSKLQELLRASSSVPDASAVENRTFIVDYAGRAMMIYPADAEMAGITRDLKRLLRASKTD